MSADIISDVRAFLAFQGELGWRGTSTAFDVPAVVAEAPAARVEARAVHAEAPKVERLFQAAAPVVACTRCKLTGAGDPSARLMFIAEADTLGAEPLTAEDQALLHKMIEAMGFKPAHVYIAGLTRCGTPDDAACVAFLRQQMSVFKPSVIVALGERTARLLLRDNTPIAKLRGTWGQYDGIAVMPTYHPALLSQNPAEKRPVWNDLKNVMARLAS